MQTSVDYILLKKANLSRKEAEYIWGGGEKFFIKSFLEFCNWHTWYNKNYWVSENIVSDKSKQDYTDYGMKKESALTNQDKIEPQYFTIP